MIVVVVMSADTDIERAIQAVGLERRVALLHEEQARYLADLAKVPARELGSDAPQAARRLLKECSCPWSSRDYERAAAILRVARWPDKLVSQGANSAPGSRG